MQIRDTREIITEIKELVNSVGYIYALCLIILDDCIIEVDKIDEINHNDRLNKNELSLLFGFLIQENISLVKPQSPLNLLEYKERTYSLMKELHNSINKPNLDKLYELSRNIGSNRNLDKKEFFGGENSFIEPIFYAADGIYDFQYLEYLEKKYKHDQVWLRENKSFELSKAKEIAYQVKSINQKKLRKINKIPLKEYKENLLNKIQKDKSVSKEIRKNDINKYLEIAEFYQYSELFNTEINFSLCKTLEEISENGWADFYTGIIDLFCISPNEFDSHLNVENFLNNFSIYVNTKGINNSFNNIGDFNLFTEKPIILLENNNYFIPLIFSLYEAIYESPYYWMIKDKSYVNVLSEHRGRAGQEITYNLLEKVFGINNIFQSVKIETKKGHPDSDIDILCILGSKALCVQVKSKKLNLHSRKGNFEQLQKDFKGAVQDAYNQGVVCRDKIFEKKATFYNINGEKIKLSEEINEVYILGITTENYPSLTHQVTTLLEKKEDTPYPLFMTIFDLELVLFYLRNPYDLMYYIRQRINLMEYFIANEEIQFLGYHLINK